MKSSFASSEIANENLTDTADRLNARACELRPGPEREEVQRGLRRLDIAEHLDEWLESPGLRRPK